MVGRFYGARDASGGSRTRLYPPCHPIDIARYRFSGCADPSAPTLSATCVPDLPATVSFSLDGGVNFSNGVALTYGRVRQLKLAFVYVGPITDFGWCAATTRGGCA